MIKNLTCIVCPVGCNLEAEVEGNTVKKSAATSVKEATYTQGLKLRSPSAHSTTTVLTDDGRLLPVRQTSQSQRI